MSIDTVLFDLDGTLIDTNELIISSFEHTFEHYGLTFTKKEIMEFNGPPLIDTFQEINPDLAEAMIDTYREHNIKHHDNFVKVFPYVLETVEQLRQHQIKMGIVSAKMRQGVLKGLSLTGLEDYFETIVSMDDVTHPKPHPEPVLKAMSNLGATPETSIMVGDNYHDIESGKNAGVKTAGVAWSEKGKEFLLNYDPTYMLEDMRDLLKIVGV
ncbi:pyrophosphatase PpaX [Virgibacillus sp. W0181]|uniref:pyrophosphatase PpaX n=1 Tax=Virgibacillus sp. W0181 TaxID=3391581 RepID=UPI003F46877F